VTLIVKILSHCQTKEHRKIIENFFSLTLLQGLNYILPLVTFPYLVRVLGAEKFGLIAFSQAYITYFMIVVDYGFNMSGTREISINKGDKQKIVEIFNAIVTAKIFLMCLSFLVLCITIFFIPKFTQHWPVYLLSFGMVIGNVIFPVWFFQGMQEMKYITLLNFLAKIIFTVFIFVIVTKEADYYYVPLLNSLGYVIAGILSLWLVIKRYSIGFLRIPRKYVAQTLRDGWHLFVSRISISLYTVTNSFILGLFDSLAVVGFYVAADKIVRASMNLLAPVYQSLYPYISEKAFISRERTLENLTKLLKITGLIGVVLSVLFVIFAKQIVLVVLGEQYLEAVSVMRILAFIPFVVTIASVFANLTMIPFKLDRYLMRIYVIGVFINILMIVIFVGVLKMRADGAALANIITEIALTIFMFYVLVKHKINFLEYLRK